MSEQLNTEKNEQRAILAVVISDKMSKTLVVQVERKVKHPLYGKYMRRFSKMYVHDEESVAKIGDTVRIQQTRPISRTKRWKLLEVVKRQDG